MWQPCPQHQLTIIPQLLQQHQQRTSVQARAYQFKQGPEAADRALAALPYLLPLLDALPYGALLLLWRRAAGEVACMHDCTCVLKTAACLYCTLV